MVTRVKKFTPEEVDQLPQGPIYQVELANGIVEPRMMDIQVLWYEPDDPMIQHDSAGRPWKIGFAKDVGFYREMPQI